MGQWEKASCCLNQKMKILGKIAVNTEAQCRFIKRREMKGIKRTLGERDVLIKKLNDINEELAKDQAWKNVQELVPIIQDINHEQQKLIDRSRQIIQEAISERTRIATELKSSKARRQVKSQYTNPWANVLQGRRFNEKG